jgi:hypothetical protein
MTSLNWIATNINNYHTRSVPIDNIDHLLLEKANKLWLLIFNKFGVDDDEWTINYKHFKLWIRNWDCKLCDYHEWVDLGGTTKEYIKKFANSKLKRKYY